MNQFFYNNDFIKRLMSIKTIKIFISNTFLKLKSGNGGLGFGLGPYRSALDSSILDYFLL